MNLEYIRLLQKYYNLYHSLINKCPSEEYKEIVTNVFINELFNIMSTCKNYNPNFKGLSFAEFEGLSLDEMDEMLEKQMKNKK